MKAALLVAAVAMTGCATQLTEAGSRVRVVTEQQRPGCQFVKLVSAQADLGPDKPGSALKKAMNEVAAAGGNGLFLVTNAVHWLDGATVAGEALRCPG